MAARRFHPARVEVCVCVCGRGGGEGTVYCGDAMNSDPRAAKRGVQGVHLHTLEILWVCKTPFFAHTASSDLCLTNVILTG